MERLAAAVVDSSVILKWFRPAEPQANTAMAIRQAYVDERLELVVPDLAGYEVANVLRHRASETVATRAVETLFDLRIPIHRLDRSTLQEAIRAAVRYGITVYDAVFLVVAEILRLQLVTADRRFYYAIRRLPKVFFLPDLRI